MAVTGRTMQAMFGLVVIILTVCEVSCLVYPGCYKLEVKLHEWTSNGKDANGDNCDKNIRILGIHPECDTLFYICIDNIQPANGWIGTEMSQWCEYTRKTCPTGVCPTDDFHNDNDIIFSIGDHALGHKIPNPFVYTEHRRWERAMMYVKIYDKDTGNDDYVDEHKIYLNGLNLDTQGNRWAYPFSTDVLQHNMIPKTSYGKRYDTTKSKLTIRYRAVCCQDYYDHDCEIHCLAQNNTQFGFYTCDPKTGAKVCRDGFLDATTDPPCVTKYDPCSSFLCYNGGSHVAKPLEKSCDCACPPGVTGHRCQTVISDTDNCPSPSPCENGGTCGSTDTGYICACPDGYSGAKCQYTTCATANFDCKNNGTCIMKGALMGCDCPSPFGGLDCSECDCSGHGTCDKAAGKCKCFPGWDGKECEVDICEHKTCLNGGKCISGQCQCLPDYTGQICEYEIGACGSNPCKNNATCTPQKQGEYKCECTIISYGDHCENIVPLANRHKEDPTFEEPKTEPVIEETSSSFPIWIIIIIVLAVLILIIVLLVALLWRQKRKRRNAEAQTEHAVRNGGLKNFDNPLYGNENRGAQTQTAVNGVAVGTQVYDTPKSKKGFSLFGGNKKKPIDDDENPYDTVGATGGNVYDVPPSKGGKPPPLPKRASERQGGQFDNPTYGGDESGSRRNKAPAYLSGVPAYSEEPPSPIKVGPIDFAEPASPEEDEDDPVKLKKKLAAKYSRA